MNHIILGAVTGAIATVICNLAIPMWRGTLHIDISWVPNE